MKYSKKTFWGIIVLCAFALTAILTPIMAAASNVAASQPKNWAPAVPGWVGGPPPEYLSPQPVMPLGMVIKPNFSLGVPVFAQNGQSWSGNLMEPCGETISSIGCALTSTAMVFKYFGVNTNPGVLNSCVYTDCSWPWPTSCASGLVKMKNVWFYNVNASVTDPTDFYYDLRYCLWVDHCPPVLQINYNGNPNTTHFVVVVAYAGSGTTADNFTINDPWNGKVWSLGNYLDYGADGSTIHEYAHS